VKIQVEFNPSTVEAFRLIGYEDRILAHQDFNDDTKDAGEIGAGIAVTALYEIVPKGVAIDLPKVDPSRYQPEKSESAGTRFGGELLFLKLRYKAPTSDQSQLITTPLVDGDREFRGASENLRFASSVAGFAMLLKGSKNAGDLSFEKVRAFAQESVGKDKGGYRAEFLGLVDRARSLAREMDELRQSGYLGGSKKR
jgi:Ca-activated chloride channel family protein